MTADIEMLAAMGIVLFLLVLAGLALVWPDKPTLTPDPVLINEPETQQAHLVWAAHVANQELDAAILNGSALDLMTAEQRSQAANAALCRHLTGRPQN